MITCGEALEMVRMAMAEDGHPPVLKLLVPADSPFVQGQASFRLLDPTVEQLSSFYRACLLMYRFAGVESVRCFSCYLAGTPIGSCTEPVPTGATAHA